LAVQIEKLLLVFSIGNKGYIGTGYDPSYKNDFWEYDPTANNWTRKADFLGSARQLAVGFSIGNKGYIGTGMMVHQKMISGSTTTPANIAINEANISWYFYSRTKHKFTIYSLWYV